jgi:hypothetical protein
MSTGYTAFVLDENTRKQVLSAIAPRFEVVVCHHITVEYGVTSEAPLPNLQRAEIVGYCIDEGGIEALIVAIDGSTTRPDGCTYHITLSHAIDREPKESNDAILEHGWSPIELGIALCLEAEFILSGNKRDLEGDQ